MEIDVNTKKANEGKDDDAVVRRRTSERGKLSVSTPRKVGKRGRAEETGAEDEPVVKRVKDWRAHLEV